MKAAFFTFKVLDAAYFIFAFLAVAAKASILKVSNIRVLCIVGMALGTMRGVAELHNPSPIRVLASCEQSEMVGVNASHVSALVVNGQVTGDFADKEQVRSPVGLQLLFAGDGAVFHDNAISSLDFFRAGPEPAVSASHRSGLNGGFSKLDLINESFEQCTFEAHVWNKKQTDLPSVKRVHNEPHSKSRFENVIALCFGRFKAATIMQEDC